MTKIDWPEIYFVRHGQTDWNAEGRYQGTRDVPLNAIGRAQADGNGPLLRTLMVGAGQDPAAFDWYASPLGRTRETMQRVRRAFDADLPPVTHDPRLVEISFGVLEGALHEELPEHLIIAPGRRDESFWDFRPEDGENYEDVAARLHAFGAELERSSVIVAHGGILRILRYLIEGAAKADVVNWFPPQDAVMHFRNGAFSLHPAAQAEAG